MTDNHVPLRTLNIFLAKPQFRGADALLKAPDEYEHHPVKAGGDYIGLLFVRPSHAQQPDWVSLFHGALDVPVTQLPLRTSSAAAVLIIERDGRSFLITFGYGWSMVEDGVVETRFGLIATLNAIHPDRIRSLDRRSFERIQRLSRDQTSQETGFDAFGLNVEQDLLRAVTGVPIESYLGARLAGRDSLATTVACELVDIPILLDLYKMLADQSDYRQRYPWIDNIAEITDRPHREQLDRHLVRNIQRGELDAIFLCPPDLLDWQEVAGFQYKNTRNAGLYSDLAWEAYFSEVRSPADVTIERLKRDRIACIRTDGAGAFRTWSLRNCIAGELSHGGSRYVLSEGHWYRIDDQYAARVIAAVENVPSTYGGLPDYDHSSEADYNTSVSETSNGQFALMDQKMIRASTIAGSIEMCDLYDHNQRFIHVKRYGASSVLSHLFAQGVVSARLFLSDRAFRDAVDDLLPASHRFPDTATPPNPRDFEIAYAVVGKHGRELRLPFFSMVNLKNALDLLGQIGYKVTLTHIRNLRP